MKAHAALREEFRRPQAHIGGTAGGSLEWEPEADRAAQAANVERLKSWGYAAEWITPKQLHELEPDIDLATVGDAPMAFFPTRAGWTRFPTRMPCCRRPAGTARG